MTHSTVEAKEESGGSTDVVFHTINITSLDAAGAETYDPDAELGVSVDSTGGISVVGQENGGYHVTWDHLNAQLSVKYADYDAAADGVLIDVPAATDVGEVVLKVEGV